jgi:D-alanyl-D-alanine carboxypeptidase/D-alanyl-D-alanine-endopeptidase (penicillin-binding protein 4)
MVWPRSRTALRVVLVIALCLAAASGGYWGARELRQKKGSALTPGVALPSAILGAAATPSASPSPSAAPVPVAASLTRVIAAAVKNSALGTRLRARIVDGITGTVLYDDDGATPAAPASTAKLMTAAAILTVHPATYRFTTKVVALGGTLVLVGGGDPTLTGAAVGQAGAYPQAARITDLAAQIKKAGITADRIVVDDALFAGPTISPDWEAEDAPSSYAGAITAVMADGGRAYPSSGYRSASPDIAAGYELATALGKPDLTISRGSAPVGAKQVASVQSAPLEVIIEQMLQDSDNVIAEVLARQVAVARHITASFLGGAQAIRAVLATLGIQVGGGMRDGSGLAGADRVAPATLVQLLRVVAGYRATTVPTDASALIAALPVAAWSGTLQDRYLSGPAAAAAGLVRAKTGSYTGVTSLAGYVHDHSGRLLVFSLDADRTPTYGTQAAESALDDIVADLASCGCG